MLGCIFLRLFAARAKPVGGEVLKRDTVMFGRIIHIAADGADVFAGRGLEDDFTRRNDGRRIVEVHDTLLLKALQRFGRVGRAGHEAVFGETDGLDFDAHGFSFRAP